VLLGKGDGTFLSAPSYAAGTNPRSVAVGDLNGDGILDLAVADQGSNRVSILLGKGDGTFQAAQNYSLNFSPQALAVGDFNGDGKLDLAVLDGSEVSVLLGKGDGTFQAVLSYAVGFNPLSVVVGDFNGDGFPDLAVANSIYPAGTVTILLNAADWGGGYAAAPPPTPAFQPRAHRSPSMDGVSLLVAESQPQKLPPSSLLATDHQSNAIRQWPMGTEADQSARPAAPSTPRSLVTVRHAQDSLFERWSDPVGNLPGTDFWR
jgi:hypothetical protein